MDEVIFYDPTKLAILPMGFCFPGLDTKGGDLPPRRECAPLWQKRVRENLPNVRLTLLVGQYAQRYWLGSQAHKTMTETVRLGGEFAPEFLPLPHPSWRNSAWLRKNPRFGEIILPMLRCRIKELLS